jgi:hypothetical protein
MGYLGRFQFSNSYLNRVSAMDCPKHLGLCYTTAPIDFWERTLLMYSLKSAVAAIADLVGCEA